MLNTSVKLPWFPAVIAITIAIFIMSCFFIPLALSIITSLVFVGSAVASGQLRKNNEDGAIGWFGIAAAFIVSAFLIMAFPNHSEYIMYIFPMVVGGTFVGIMYA